MDILETNPFNKKKVSNTYGVQDQIKRYQLNEHVNKKVQILDNPDKGNLLDDDIINTNPAVQDQIREVVDRSRYIKEIRHFINIDSRNRKLFEEELVPKHPVTGQYIRETCDKDGNIRIKRFTADDLNLEHDSDYSDNPITDPFFERNDEIYYKKPVNSNPNNYTVFLPKMLHNVKAIRLISTEIPNPNKTINEFNNLILIDIRNLTDGNSIKLKNDGGTPFFLIKIPVGNYEFRELLEILESSINKTVCKRSYHEYKSLFKVTGNINTGKVQFSIKSLTGKCQKLVFHMRFWFAPCLPKERLLYYMLGFERPYLRNPDGTSKYVTAWNNLVKTPTHSCKLENININKSAQSKEANSSVALLHYGIKQERPFRQINLSPETYIYLVIDEAKSLLDLSQPSTDTFAKVQLPTTGDENQILFNTFVQTPKFYTEVIRFLEKLSIKWVDREGNLVDFHGRNHSFTLDITQYVDELAVNNYSSLRGVIDSTSFTSKERIFSYHQ